jgi:hypothetical protein
MKRCRAVVLLASLVLGACRYQDEFRNVPANEPHAVLRGTKYPDAGAIFAGQVNGQPTSFWRFGDVFRIPAGDTLCRLAFSDRKETITYQPARFPAVANRIYVIERKREPGVASPFSTVPHPTTPNSWAIHDRRDRAVIRETRSNGADRIVADVPKESFVFGVESPAVAISKYHRETP